MKAKKILTLALAGSMALSTGVHAIAAEISTDGGSQNTIVTYGMDQSFIVTIPTNFTIDSSNKAVAIVSATEVMIPANATLEVTVTGSDYSNAWELIDQDETANRLVYTIGTTECGTDIINNSIVLDVEAGEASGATEVKEEMYFTVTDTLTKAGTYKDTLTFKVGVYTLAEGSGQQYNAAAPAALTFRSQQPVDELEEVLLNDEVVDEDNYTVTEGSTIVTFKDSFLATLPNGNYRLSFKFSKAVTSASFNVTNSKVEVGKEEDKILAAGLYDENDTLIASWEELGMDESYLDGTSVLPNYPTGKKLVLQGYVGSSGFYGVSNIEEIILLDGVSGIGNAAFSYMTHLKKITIPTSVTMILYAPFENVYTLTDVYYKGTMEQFESIQFNEYWMNATNATTNLHCSDGTVKFSQITVDESGNTTITR